MNADPIIFLNEPEEKTMSKTREEKIESMAAELKAGGITFNHMRGSSFANIYEVAERLLDAAERETPKWPTSESFNAALEVFSSFDEPVTPLALQNALSAAMSVDPIVVAARKAISELRSWGLIESKTMATLEDAVSEAGLL